VSLHEASVRALGLSKLFRPRCERRKGVRPHTVGETYGTGKQMNATDIGNKAGWRSMTQRYDQDLLDTFAQAMYKRGPS
jgi:hypothetical protein